MHAFLIIGREQSIVDEKIVKLIEKLRVALVEFPLAKIDDVRTLNSFTKLHLDPTGILIREIDRATHEALNAFLKNLEEPQESLYYILTAKSVAGVLPTIVSRCQVIRIRYQESGIKNQEIEKFLKMSVGEKLAFVDKIRDREDAIRLVEDFISACHNLLHESQGKYLRISRSLQAGSLALKNLKANGNVTLQLANFVINLDN